MKPYGISFKAKGMKHAFQSLQGMKGSGAVTVASTVITAAASYSTASLSDAKPHAPSCQELASWQQQQRRRPPPSATTEERFAPRFDGLRFVETLVTAHR